METLAKRIKDLPSGTKLYSPCYGEIRFGYVTEAGVIICYDSADNVASFHPNGSIHNYGECMLFPSKEYCDWDKFLSVCNKFDMRSLQPFDKVLVRDGNIEAWRADFFSFYEVGSETFDCVAEYWYQCIPYNDETKHLLGTTERAPEYYITWEE